MSKQYQNSTGWWAISAASIIIILFIVARSGKSTSSKTNREVALMCTTDMATQFHIHPHLEIVINGQGQEIPANIGIAFSCMNALHTHDNSGTIHVESPEKRDFTLSDFFAVWNKPFAKDQILYAKVDGSHIIKVMVDGKDVDTFENTVLRDNQQIVISYEQMK